MNQEKQKLSNAVEVIINFVGGIAIVTAIISALLSASGFLVLRSHANLLGLSSFLHHSIGDYLYEGGVFFILTFLWALPASIIGNLYGWVFVAGVSLYLLGKRIKYLSILLRKFAEKLKPKEIFQQAWIRWICIVVAAFLFLVCIYQISPSLEAKDLLFPTGNQQEVAKRAAPKSAEEMESRYEYSLLYVILSGLVLWGINKIHQDQEKKSSSALLYVYDWLKSSYTEELKTEQKTELLFVLGRLFLVLLFTVELVLLPINYGQSVYSNDFQKVNELMLAEKFQNETPRSENLWLIKENPDSFIIYFGDTQEIRLIQKTHVVSISISGRENIFRNKMY